jgi:uncharacterized protein YunC (DUF1805 family)
MDIITKSCETKNGLAEGVQIKWQGLSILLVTGSKGFLLCGVFDLTRIDSFGAAAAMVESSPDTPIGNLERFPLRTVTAANKNAEAPGIHPGMDVIEAFRLDCIMIKAA